MSRRVVIYARISRDKEGAGLGVKRQADDCRALAEQLGWPVVAVHTDNDLGASKGKPRPGYLALLDDLETGRAAAVIAWHTDRLHRSPVELEHYIEVCQPRDVPTVTVKAGPLDLSTPAGRMVARQLGAIAKYEVEHAADRQRRARLQAATAGRWSGGPRPYGYARDGVTMIESEAAVVRHAADQVLAGVTLGRLVRQLNASGQRTSTGRPWTTTELRRMLQRPRIAGLMQHRGEVIGQAEWPAIVDEDTWRAVAGILSDPDRRTTTGNQPRWLLSGIARCGKCGAPVRATSVARKPTYSCKAGKHVARLAAGVDQLVTAVILERLSRPDVRDLLDQDTGTDTRPLHARAAVLRERLDGLATAYADGTIDGRQLAEGTQRARAQLAEIESQLAAAARGSVLEGVADAPDPAAVWAGLNLDRQRAIVALLLEVTILPARKGRRAGWAPGETYFDPATVCIKPKRG